ncbi:hypothetical protein WOLCODRAFT_141295 [Wolfiporia cocos MD-104 SS10]|uniref:Phosducin domain-containing protein n=1 Tax=Wolfiporia cocos (strain MD-104) TaxID=742152 RepID=A0A2H3JD68_WOLCO|nr:hypothetical protein WOLCODRAFT_141295 [Wolfiporia cocos MD-104 SS10]
MYGDIEELVLSGKLFSPPSRSTSPVRSRSPSPTPAQWPTDDADYEYDSDAERRRAIESRIAADAQSESIGMGPGRTGVKGVIRDHAEAAASVRAKRTQEIIALNREMERASLGGKTWAEEERERIAEEEQLEGKASSMVDGRGSRRGPFGHLMEVGVRSFVQAVEEDRSMWVVVHIYDPSLDRCAALDDVLARLARSFPSTKFLRARAGGIGFAATKTSATSRLGVSRSPFGLRHSESRQILVPGRFSSAEDDDELFDDDRSEDGSSNDGWDDDAVDTDVLPTLLVYRGGVLEHTWVRVDWEAKMGVEELLRRHNILRGSEVREGPSVDRAAVDDEDDLDDGELVFGGSDEGS